MASADTAKLLASLDMDTRKFNAGGQKAIGTLGRLSAKTTAVGTAIGVGLERLAEKGISFLVRQLSEGEAGLRQLQDAQAQTGAVIESTGGKAGITAAKVRELAEAQEALTTVDDKVIQSGENMLLTFTGIGKDVFPLATKAMVDMAVAMNGGNAEGIDLKTTAIQIGKALNDPIKGVTALRKVGVAFTEQQIKQIKAMVKSGDVMGAQKLILKELETEFGKAGQAAGTSGAAGVRRLNDAVEDAQIALAEGLAPALDDIRGQIATTLSDPSTKADIRNLGKWIGEAATQGVAFARSIPWDQVRAVFSSAVDFGKNIANAFLSLPTEAKGLILGLAALNKLSGGAVINVGVDLLKGAGGTLFQQFLGKGSPANPMFVVPVGGGLGGPGGVAPVGAGGAAKFLGGVVVSAAVLTEALMWVQDNVNLPKLQEQAGRNITGTEAVIATGDPAKIQAALDGVRAGVASLDGLQRVLYDLNANGVKTHTEGLEAALTAALDRSKIPAASSRNAYIAGVKADAQKAALDRLRTSAIAESRGMQIAQRSSADRIVTAIHQNRPIISVSITGNTVRATYASGTTVARNINPNYLKLL